MLVKGITMNTSRVGADLEQFMMFPKLLWFIQGIRTVLICKGLHQNTLIKQSTTLLEQYFSIYLV